MQYRDSSVLACLFIFSVGEDERAQSEKTVAILSSSHNAALGQDY